MLLVCTSMEVLTELTVIMHETLANANLVSTTQAFLWQAIQYGLLLS